MSAINTSVTKLSASLAGSLTRCRHRMGKERFMSQGRSGPDPGGTAVGSCGPLVRLLPPLRSCTGGIVGGDGHEHATSMKRAAKTTIQWLRLAML
jgi:hypothetical protein